MNKYFKNAYVSQFNVKYIPFEKDFFDGQQKPTFKTKLTDLQLNHFFEYLKIECIDKNTSYNLFRAVFNGKGYASNEKIKWILLNKKKVPHKSALREFLELTIDGKPTQKIIDNWFSDVKGEPIKLAKPKKGEYSNYFSDFEKALKE